MSQLGPRLLAAARLVRLGLATLLLAVATCAVALALFDREHGVPPSVQLVDDERPATLTLTP